jgi:hypothetical protein
MWAGPGGEIENFGIIYGATHDSPELLGWWVIPISVVLAVALWIAAGWIMRRGGKLLLRTTP